MNEAAMNAPPPVIHSARLIAFAENDSNVEFTDDIVTEDDTQGL